MVGLSSRHVKASLSSGRSVGRGMVGRLASPQGCRRDTPSGRPAGQIFAAGGARDGAGVAGQRTSRTVMPWRTAMAARMSSVIGAMSSLGARARRPRHQLLRAVVGIASARRGVLELRRQLVVVPERRHCTRCAVPAGLPAPNTPGPVRVVVYGRRRSWVLTRPVKELAVVIGAVPSHPGGACPGALGGQRRRRPRLRVFPNVPRLSPAYPVAHAHVRTR